MAETVALTMGELDRLQVSGRLTREHRARLPTRDQSAWPASFRPMMWRWQRTAS